PDDNSQALLLNLVHKLIGAAKYPLITGRFHVVPGEDLLDVAEVHQANPVQVNRCPIGIPPEEGLNAITQRGKGRVHNREALERVSRGAAKGEKDKGKKQGQSQRPDLANVARNQITDLAAARKPYSNRA